MPIYTTERNVAHSFFRGPSSLVDSSNVRIHGYVRRCVHVFCVCMHCTWYTHRQFCRRQLLQRHSNYKTERKPVKQTATLDEDACKDASIGWCLPTTVWWAYICVCCWVRNMCVVCLCWRDDCLLVVYMLARELPYAYAPAESLQRLYVVGSAWSAVYRRSVAYVCILCLLFREVRCLVCHRAIPLYVAYHWTRLFVAGICR